MDSESSHLCPECGKPVPAVSPHQLCPACLMGQALASRTLVGNDDDDDVPPPLSPEEIAEKFPQFEITECLGRGGMGSVYKARQKSLDRWVAIKILAPEREGRERFAERFAREAQTLARLSHPHIVTIHDFGQTDGLFYLVMEYVDGVNLRELLRDGKIEPAQALTIVPPICDALQYAHDKGVVHRDIKPENLLLDRDGRVKIADFGIASLIGAENESSGTPAYMAPEQADAKREVDHRADIYALGVVLYEMLTGERPGENAIAPSSRMRGMQIDVRLDEIVLRALEKKPELRFQNATLFKTRVEAIAETPSSHVTQPSVGSRLSGKAISRPIPRAAKFALGLLIASLAGPMLMDLIPETFVMIASASLALLATLLGLKSWRSRLGKFAAMSAGTWLVVWLVYTIGFRSPLGSLHRYTDQSLYPRLQIPKDYGGLLVVAHPLAAYPELPVRGNKQILRFPEDGVLLTSSPLRFGPSATRTLETYDPKTEKIWGGSEMSCNLEYDGFGTTEDGVKFEFRIFEIGDELYWQRRKGPVDFAALKEDARRRVLKHLESGPGSAHKKEPVPTLTVSKPPIKAEERYSLKVQFGDGQSDPSLTMDIQLGVAFSDVKREGQRVLSIDGRIDPPTGGVYHGELRYLDVDASQNLSVQKSGLELALVPGVPFRFLTVNGVARFCVVTLTRKQPEEGSPIDPTIDHGESTLMDARPQQTSGVSISPAPAFPEASQSWDPWAQAIKNGDMRRLNGDLDAALESYRSSLSEAEKTKGEPLRKTRLAASHMGLGDVSSALGDLPAAREHYRTTVAIREELAKQAPDDDALRQQLTWGRVKLGDVLRAQGNMKEALQSYRGGAESEKFWRQIFEASSSDYHATEVFDPAELTRLAAEPKKNFRRLMWLINRAGAEKDTNFRYLLEQKDLRQDAAVNLALLGYDYSVNGNGKALDELLATLAKEPVGSDSSVVVALSFVDEWDRVQKAVTAHFAATDGAGSYAKHGFENIRSYLFPRRMLEFQGQADAASPVVPPIQLKESTSVPTDFLRSALMTIPPIYLGDIPLARRESWIKSLERDPERMDAAKGWMHQFGDGPDSPGSSMIWLKILPRTNKSPVVLVHMAKPFAAGGGGRLFANQTFVLERDGEQWKDVTQTTIPATIDLTTHHFRTRKEDTVIEVAPWKAELAKDRYIWIFGERLMDLWWDGEKFTIKEAASKVLTNN